MEGFLVRAAQLILSLSILVVLHELGHFIPAKLFKTRVEKFYLFFNPWFSLFKIKKGETEYGIGWLPLGGFVKISGMIDESMDQEQMAKPPQPWEFRSKPAWQRLIIMVGGVVVNLLLGYFIYIMVLFTWGKEYLPVENAIYGVHCDSVMLNNGFKEGDKILKVGEEKPLTFGDISKQIIISSEKDILVLRDGKELNIKLPVGIEDSILANNSKQLFTARFPFHIEKLMKGKGAIKSGLEKGDKILAVNNEPTPYYFDFSRKLADYKNQTISVTVDRNGSEKSFDVEVDEKGLIGIMISSPDDYLNFATDKYTFAQSIPAGIAEGSKTLVNYVKSLRLLFSKEGAKQMGGFGAIGGMFPQVWDWQSFWMLTAFISIILAFMNILPIPALDGGHVMFLLYEMISGRPPSEKFMEKAQLAGMFLLIALVLFSNGNDIYKAIFK